MKECERCGAEEGNRMFDYCADCSKNLCPECMEEGCCGNIPATSGLEADAVYDMEMLAAEGDENNA